jgi:hypothetical protein
MRFSLAKLSACVEHQARPADAYSGQKAFMRHISTAWFAAITLSLTGVSAIALSMMQ